MNGDHITQRSRRFNTVAEMDLSKARRAIDYLLFTCSTTMREPLRNISHLCAQVKDCDFTAASGPMQLVENIQQKVIQMESVISDLQTFLSYAHDTIAVKSIDASTMVKGILAEYQQAMTQHNIQVTVMVSQSEPFFTDQRSFRMVLDQLISNAVKFFDESKSRREVNVVVKISRSTCFVEVRDNGVGIDPSIASEIFNLFFKGAHSRSGSGVGLFIVKELIAALGGDMTMTSNPGEGTEFCFQTENLWVSPADDLNNQ